MYLAWARCNYNVHAHGFVLFSAGGATYSKTSFKKFRRAKLWDPILLHAIKHHSLQLTERLKGGPRENLHTPMKRKLRHWRFHAFQFHFIILSGALKRDSNVFHTQESKRKRSIYNPRDQITLSQLISDWGYVFKTAKSPSHSCPRTLHDSSDIAITAGLLLQMAIGMFLD